MIYTNDEKGHINRYVVAENKRQEAREKKLCFKFIRIIQVKKVMMQILILIEYKHLLVNLKHKKK